MVGLQRGMTLRESLPPGQVIDVQFADFMRDPFATIRSLYGRLDRELTPTAEQQDARSPGGPSRRRRRRPLHAGPTPASTPDQFREQVSAYQERYGVPTEPLK